MILRTRYTSIFKNHLIADGLEHLEGNDIAIKTSPSYQSPDQEYIVVGTKLILDLKDTY